MQWRYVSEGVADVAVRLVQVVDEGLDLLDRAGLAGVAFFLDSLQDVAQLILGGALGGSGEFGDYRVGVALRKEYAT